MKLESNYHSMFLLHYHLVLVMKYWRKVFDDTIFTRVFRVHRAQIRDNRRGMEP